MKNSNIIIISSLILFVFIINPSVFSIAGEKIADTINCSIFAQKQLCNREVDQISCMRIDKYSSKENKNDDKIPKYFKDIAIDIVNDGIHSITDIPGTFRSMFTIPFRRENRISTSISSGFLGSSFLLDKKADEFFKDRWDPYCNKYVPKGKFPLPVLTFGLDTNNDYYDNVFLAFAEYGYAFGLLSRNLRFKTLCFNLMECTVYSFSFTQGMKALTGRARPWRKDSNFKDHGPWEWGNINTYIGSGGEYNSFPSFHATYYFSYWTIVMNYLGHRWAGPIMASIFYFQNRNCHWLSDMVAGGILGYWIGTGIIEKSKENHKHKASKTSFMIYPFNNGICFNVSKAF